MKLFVWNINQIGGYRIPRLIATEILESSPDIVVLTECLNATDEKKMNIIQEFIAGPLNDKYKIHYNLESRECSGDHGVLIAIKKSADGQFASNSMSEATIISKIEKMNTVRKEQPDFLQIDMFVNGELLSVIGTKIRATDYVKRHEQLLSLIEHIKTLGNKNILVAGNFSNGYIHGEEHEFYIGENNARENYRLKEKALHYTFNYHMMKDDFYDIGMKLSTPYGEQYSSGFEINEDGYPNDGYLKEDHVLTTRTLSAGNLRYSHQFMKKGNGEWSIKPPFPNHSILTATIFFKGIERIIHAETR